MASIAIVVEYSIQSLAESTQMKSAGNQYPNVYILSQRYTSIKEVNIAEVIKSFPLNDEKLSFDNLIFRFETSIYNSKTGKKIVVFKDIMANDISVLEKI